jgi:hypothetical protein
MTTRRHVRVEKSSRAADLPIFAIAPGANWKRRDGK